MLSDAGCMVSLSPQRQPIARPARLPAIERVTSRGREANGAVRAGHLAISKDRQAQELGSKDRDLQCYGVNHLALHCAVRK